jgi:predicted CXXCH cytochrome family protein
VLWVGVALVLAAIVAGGCSAEKRYRVLSFFFDGVPDPNAPPGAALDEQSGFASSGQVVKAFIHKPYAEGKCDSCHTGANQGYASFQKVGSEICLKCHQDQLTKYPIMHGPVVAVECNLCHAAHESTIPGMLNYETPQVCVQCHDRELLSANPPEHLAEKSPCLSCHVGHGGPKHKLLRADFAPATRPAALGAPTTRGGGA